MDNELTQPLGQLSPLYSLGTEFVKGQGGTGHAVTPEDTDALRIAQQTMRNQDIASGRIQPEVGGVSMPSSIRAYHGSPHEFDQFDTSKIGTGEGAQAYGHGLYFAESEPVARGYRDRLTDYPSNQVMFPHSGDERYDPNQFDDPIYQAAAKALLSYSSSKGYKDYLRRAPIEFEDAVSAMKLIKNKEIVPAPSGHMYQVNIATQPEHFLDWDKPLSEQPQHIQDFAKNINVPESGKRSFEVMRRWQKGQDDPNYPATGSILHNIMTDYGTDPNLQQKASQQMLDAGIKGIKYLDAGSRSAGEGSRNYVVFDPNDIEIMRRYARGGDVRVHHAGGTVEDHALHLARHLMGGLHG
jgi:hypothetical protein